MVLAVVMALVPRNVRVTSVALYNFVITNISGLSTTLVPLLRARYDTPHTFRFFAEPLAGAATATAAIANVNATDIAYAAAKAAVNAAVDATATASGSASGSASGGDSGGAGGIASISDSVSDSVSGGGSAGEWSGPVSGLTMLSSPSSPVPTQAGDLRAAAAVGRGGGWAGGGGAVEFSVSTNGSRGLQAALLWMYPGMFLASSGERVNV